MRAVDTVAWTETLGVGRKELPWALKGKSRQIADLYEEVSRLRAALVGGSGRGAVHDARRSVPVPRHGGSATR